MSNIRKQKRDLHALNSDGMVLCNPRDKEAAHRAAMEGIATEDRAAVTCRKCRTLIHVRLQLSPEQRAELARRDAEMDANPNIAMTWEQIRASVECSK